MNVNRTGKNSGALGRRKRLTGVAAAFVAVALTVAACGGSDSKDEGSATDSPSTVAHYKGADRQDKLVAGAKKEGTLNLYTNPTGDITNAIVEAFEKKYPDVKVKVTSADSADLARRISEEAAAGRNGFDVLETTTGAIDELNSAKLLTDFKSPEEKEYAKDSVKPHYVGVRESYLGLGYNTDKIPASEVPKTIDELLSPKWKGKISLPTSATGVRWIAALELTQGDDILDRLKAQNIKGQNISGRALADFVVSGEVALSPTIYNSHVAVSAEKGAPIAWQPIEPVIAVPSALAMAKNAPNPNASMLYIDFALSKEGQEIYKANGYDSARSDMPSSGDFKKIYIDTRDDYATEFPKWEKDMRTLFLK